MAQSTKLDTSKLLGFDKNGELLFDIAHPDEKGQSQTVAAGTKNAGGKFVGIVKT